MAVTLHARSSKGGARGVRLSSPPPNSLVSQRVCPLLRVGAAARGGVQASGGPRAAARAMAGGGGRRLLLQRCAVGQLSDFQRFPRGRCRSCICSFFELLAGVFGVVSGAEGGIECTVRLLLRAGRRVR